MLALTSLRASVDSALGKCVGQAFMLLTSLQFHLPFYASRPLPNTFALALASLAHADWITSTRPRRAIVLMAAAVVGPATPLSTSSVQHVLAREVCRKQKSPK